MSFKSLAAANRRRLDPVSAFLYLLLFYTLGLSVCVQADLFAQV